MKFNLKVMFISLVLLFGIVSCSEGSTASPIIEQFTFSSNGEEIKGKIYLPAVHQTKNDLPAIFLINFMDTHFENAVDEYERLIDAVEQTPGLDALVVSLEEVPDIDARPDDFQAHYEIYQDLAGYVDGRYTNNSSRTLVGRGSEGGIVFVALFQNNLGPSLFDNFIATDPSPHYITEIINMLEDEDFSGNQENKKLHFSYSTSNSPRKCNAIISLIADAQYDWLDFESIQYTDSNYENSYPIVFADGVDFIFNSP